MYLAVAVIYNTDSTILISSTDTYTKYIFRVGPQVYSVRYQPMRAVPMSLKTRMLFFGKKPTNPPDSRFLAI